MSTNNQLEQQIQELVRVGVGGKYRTDKDYLKLIADELIHEQFMMQGGITRYRKQITDAKSKGQESTTLYGIVIQQKYITLLSEQINKDIKTLQEGGAGNRHTALKLLCQCLPKSAFNDGIFLDNDPSIWDSVSLVILKNSIDCVSTQSTINKLALNIAQGLMMEARINTFKDNEKESYNKVNRYLNSSGFKQSKNKYRYKRNVWVYFINKSKLVFDNWEKSDRLHLGVKMINYCEQLGLITHRNRKLARNKTVCYVEATEKLIQEIDNFNIRNEALTPTFLPMISPPLDWTTPFSGGYYGRKYNETNKPEETLNALQSNQSK